MKEGTKAVLFGFFAVIALVAIGFAIWGLTVAFSPTAGKAAVYKDQNSSQNREYWSPKYAQDWSNLQADHDNLVTLHSAMIGGTQQDKINYEGAQLNCRQDVATYNTDTANVLGYKFIPEGQPSSVSADTFCN